MNPLNPGLIVGHDLTIVSMIMNASVVVKAVMAMLVVASLLSWTYIFMKLFAIGRARRQADEFEREFWGGTDLVGMYQRASSGRYAATGTRAFTSTSSSRRTSCAKTHRTLPSDSSRTLTARLSSRRAGLAKSIAIEVTTNSAR